MVVIIIYLVLGLISAVVLSIVDKGSHSVDSELGIIFLWPIAVPILYLLKK